MAAIDYGTLIFKNQERVNETFLDASLELENVTFEFWKNIIKITASRKTEEYYLDGNEHLVWKIKTPLGIAIKVRVIDDKRRNRHIARFTYQGDHYTIIFGYGIDDIMTGSIYKMYGITKKEQKLLNTFSRRKQNE